MRISFESWSSFPRQAIEIDMRPGKISSGSVRAGVFNIFTDTAPLVSQYRLLPTKKQRDFAVSHAWDNGRSITGLVGPFGIIVEEREEELKLYCNDSFDQVTFADLVVSLSIRAPSSTANWIRPVWLNKAKMHEDWQRAYLYPNNR
jgi:hypothetical protein